MAKTMVDFMKWMLVEARNSRPGSVYAPLPDAVIKLELAALNRIKVS